MYTSVAPKAIVDKKTKIAVKNFSVNQFSISEFERYKILFLPGVGSFDQLIKGLKERKIYQYLKNFPNEKFLIDL